MRHHDASAVQPGAAAFAAAFLLFSLFLLSQLTAETRFSAGGKLFAQPRFWPAIGVAGMSLFGVFHFWNAWKARQEGGLAEAAVWLRALEYFAWFMAYVAAVPFAGYLLATILFTVLLAVRQGYGTFRQLAAAAALGAGIVLVFKTALAVKIPGGAIYDILPSGLRSFMILNF